MALSVHVLGIHVVFDVYICMYNVAVLGRKLTLFHRIF